MKPSLLLAAFAALPGLTHGETTFAPAATDTEYVSVIGTRSAQTDLAVPAAIQIISHDDITRSGAQTVLQVLASLGGLQINDVIGNGGRGASLSLRGFGENGVNNILVLVDGRKLNNPSLAAPDLASIALQNVVRIEILHGSAGALYGDQASAGVINIITSQPDAQRITLEASRGSDDLERYRAAAQQQFDNGLAYRVAAEKQLTDNYRDHNAQDYRNLFGTLSWRLAQAKLLLDVQQTRDDLQLPGSLTRAQREADREQASSLTDFGNRDTDAWRFGVDATISENWQLLADLSHREEDNEGALYAAPFRYEAQVKAAQPRLSGQIGEMELLIGLDLEEATAESDYGFGVTAIEQDTRDLYSQISLPLGAAWTLTGGGRHSRFDGDHNTTAELSQSLNAWQLGASYQLHDDHRFFARVDEGFRWPTADENGFISPTIDRLAPQQSTSWELGIDSRFAALTMTTVLYQLQLTDEIFYDPAANGPFGPGTGANVNLDDSERSGLVLRGTWPASDAIKTHFNYSYVDAQFDSGRFAGSTVPFVAEQQFGAGLSWQVGDTFTLYGDAQYTGQRYPAGDNANTAGQLGGYTLFNASARWQQDSWFVLLRINNLTDKEYDGFAGVSTFGPAYYYPAAGRQFELKVGYSL